MHISPIHYCLPLSLTSSWALGLCLAIFHNWEYIYIKFGTRFFMDWDTATEITSKQFCEESWRWLNHRKFVTMLHILKKRCQNHTTEHYLFRWIVFLFLEICNQSEQLFEIKPPLVTKKICQPAICSLVYHSNADFNEKRWKSHF